MSRLTTLALKALATKDQAGERKAPGTTKGMHWKLPDEQDLVVSPQGETVDFYVGRKDVLIFTLPTSAAMALAFWLIRWWAGQCWLGLRLRLWQFFLARRYNEALNEKPKASGVSGSPRP